MQGAMFNLFKKRPTSKETLKRWFEALISQDEEALAKYSQKTWLKNHTAGTISGWAKLGVKQYKILSCEEISRAMHKYKVSVRNRSGSMKIQITLVKERKAYRAGVRFGRWGVNPTSWRLLSS